MPGAKFDYTPKPRTELGDSGTQWVQGTCRNIAGAASRLQAGMVVTGFPGFIWGGCGITDSNSPTGPAVTLATSVANLTGFTVFDQADAMLRNGGQVALAGAGMGVNFYRLDSGAQLVLPCSEATAKSLGSKASNTPVSWDFVNQCVIPGASSAGAIPCTLIAARANSVCVVNASAGRGEWNVTGSGVVIQI